MWGEEEVEGKEEKGEEECRDGGEGDSGEG